MFVMEIFSSFQCLNLPVIILKNIDKVVIGTKGKHSIPYRFLLNRVFELSGVQVVATCIKYLFTRTMLEKCEIIKKKKV